MHKFYAYMQIHEYMVSISCNMYLLFRFFSGAKTEWQLWYICMLQFTEALAQTHCDEGFYKYLYIGVYKHIYIKICS